MLDPLTLRLTLGAVSIVVLVLFYLAVYRPTRSAFSGWWTVALLCSASASTLLLLNGSALQVLANPAATGIGVVGATCVWFATRSLRDVQIPRWVLVVAPVITFVRALLDHPDHSRWAGNDVLFVFMAAAFCAAAVEVWLTWRQRSNDTERSDHLEALTALAVCGLAALVLGLYYGIRSVLYLMLGPEDANFTKVLGVGTTSMLLIVCLVAVTFSVSAIGWDQRTRELRRRAIEDDLTGLLGRTAFLERVQVLRLRAGTQGHSPWLVIADLDHFKRINDAYGHAAGDRTLIAFADALRGAVRPSDAVGRLGGEEFGVIFNNLDEDAVLDRLHQISERFSLATISGDMEMPTVSYGVAALHAGDSVVRVLEDADRALYRAKRGGRDRVAVDGGSPEG